MKYLINLLLECISILILFNILIMLIPKFIKRGFNGTIRLVEIIGVNILNLVKEQVVGNSTRHKPSKKQSNKVINFNDKANKKES